MRRSFDGLAALVQTAFAENPFFGHVFMFRGRRGDILKVLWFDGQGPMLLANHSFTSCHLKQQVRCCIPCDHIPVRSWALVRARGLMRHLIESLQVDQQRGQVAP